jgi:hypothetical protein
VYCFTVSITRAIAREALFVSIARDIASANIASAELFTPTRLNYYPTDRPIELPHRLRWPVATATMQEEAAAVVAVATKAEAKVDPKEDIPSLPPPKEHVLTGEPCL